MKTCKLMGYLESGLTTCNQKCPACRPKGHHMDMSAEEMRQYHPEAGHGFCKDHRLAGR